MSNHDGRFHAGNEFHGVFTVHETHSFVGGAEHCAHLTCVVHIDRHRGGAQRFQRVGLHLILEVSFNRSVHIHVGLCHVINVVVCSGCGAKNRFQNAAAFGIHVETSVLRNFHCVVAGNNAFYTGVVHSDVHTLGVIHIDDDGSLCVCGNGKQTQYHHTEERVDFLHK